MLAPCLPNLVTHHAGPTFRGLLLGGLLLLIALPPAGAQNLVERTDPPLEETVGVSPEQIGIWFAEPLAEDPGAITIQLVDGAGRTRTLGTPSIYSLDPRHVSVPVTEEVSDGTYSVLWTARFAGNESERAGAYGFRVGSPALPGAATEVDAFPAFWAVGTRLLTLLGLALALGGLMTRGSGVETEGTSATHRARTLMILSGGALALIATIAEPAIAAVTIVPSPSFIGYPAVWWPRTGALVVLIAAAFVFLAGAGSTGLRRAAWLVATIAGTIALVATCSTGLALDAAAPNTAAASAVVILQALIVLLTGAALQSALFGPSAAAADPADTAPQPTRRPFSGRAWLTAALAAFALLGTIALGLLTLPGALDLIERLFGQLLLITAVLLAVIFLLALLLRRQFAATGRWGLAALAALSLVTATVLSLVLPPSGAAMPASLAAVSLVSPVPLTIAGEPGLAHLQIQPVTPGENALIAWLSTPAGVAPTGAEQPEVEIELRSLNHDTPPVTATPAAGDTGVFTIATATLPSAGWWQATAAFVPETGEPATAEFFFLLPDPNVVGYGPQPETSAAAEAVFERGLAAMTSLHQVRFSISLGSGAGTFATSEITIDDGSDGSPRGYQERAPTYERVIVGDQEWLRFDGEEWTERQAGYLYVPADWGATYERATGFALGPIVEVAGEPAQVVTFWLPRQDDPTQAPAWFAWWVGTETGQVHRETMISNRHYMVYNFAGFNQPVEIVPPADL